MCGSCLSVLADANKPKSKAKKKKKKEDKKGIVSRLPFPPSLGLTLLSFPLAIVVVVVVFLLLVFLQLCSPPSLWLCCVLGQGMCIVNLVTSFRIESVSVALLMLLHGLFWLWEVCISLHLPGCCNVEKSYRCWVWGLSLCMNAEVICLVCWLLSVPTTCLYISRTDLPRQLYVLPHWDKSCRSNCLTQSQYTDFRPASPNDYPLMPGAWQSGRWSANVYVTGMTQPGKIPTEKMGITLGLPFSRGTP